MTEGDIWNEVKKERQKKRWQNEEMSLKILQERGIKYETLNAGIGHYRVNGISFWPTTGKYYDPKTGLKGRGVYNLIKELEKMSKTKEAKRIKRQTKVKPPVPPAAPEIKPLICPHCNAPIERVEWRYFGDGGYVGVIGCGHCFKALGATLKQ